MNDLADIKQIKISSPDQALALLDEGLQGLSGRQLVSAAEMTDLLLDVRALLVVEN